MFSVRWVWNKRRTLEYCSTFSDHIYSPVRGYIFYYFYYISGDLILSHGMHDRLNAQDDWPLPFWTQESDHFQPEGFFWPAVWLVVLGPGSDH